MSYDNKNDYFHRIQQSIDFIELNIKSDITLDDIAAQTYFSKYHFQRIFLAIVGETPFDYTRKRRMTMAAEEINEHGLCVTFSAGVPGSNPKEYGFKFWAVIRTILDSLKTVKESIDFINNVPISDNINLIITDKNGEAALVEVACSKKSIEQVNSNTIEKYLCATNHYTLPEMIQYDINRKWHSVTRHNITKERLDMAIPCINKSTIRNIHSDTIPEGACCHYYSKGFGTLWSMIFDITAVNVEICFGSPKENDWIVFGMDDPIGITKYKAKLPYETADSMI